MPDRSIPEDFPQATPGGAVPGVQPKLGVAKVGMSYVATENFAQTREVRFALCVDLVQQLLAYWQRKRAERPHEAADKLLEKVLTSTEKKRFAWGLSPAEADWVAYSLRTAARNHPSDGE